MRVVDPTPEGTVCQVISALPQAFHRVRCDSYPELATARFHYFVEKVRHWTVLLLIVSLLILFSVVFFTVCLLTRCCQDYAPLSWSKLASLCRPTSILSGCATTPSRRTWPVHGCVSKFYGRWVAVGKCAINSLFSKLWVILGRCMVWGLYKESGRTKLADQQWIGDRILVLDIQLLL